MEKVMVALFLGMSSACDLKKREIPFVLIGVFAALGMIAPLFGGITGGWGWVFGGAIGLCVLGIGKITRESIGYGDGFAIMVIGIWLGLFSVIEIFFLALVLSAVASAYLLIRKKAGGKYRIAFLPFLMGAYMIWLAAGIKEVM